MHPQPEPESQGVSASSPEREFTWSPTPAAITGSQQAAKAILDRVSSLRSEHHGSLDLLPSIEQSPDPARVSLPPPQSQNSTARVLKASASTRGGVRGRRLTEDDEVLLARVCCRHGESYGKGTNWVTDFWISIAASFQAERNGVCYSQKSCRAKMEEIVAQGRVEIARKESGAERREKRGGLGNGSG